MENLNEKHIEKVFKLISSSGSNGIEKWKFNRQIRYSSTKYRDKIINELIIRGKIAIVKELTNGAPATKYVSVQNSEAILLSGMEGADHASMEIIRYLLEGGFSIQQVFEAFEFYAMQIDRRIKNLCN
jgi:hypothetical protein